MTPAETLSRVGQALYGTEWQTDLARALAELHHGSNPESMRTNIKRWLSGRYDPPHGVWRDIAALMRERQTELMDLTPFVLRMDRATDPGPGA